MAKLYRPHIPLKVRVQVAERQLLKAAGDAGFAGICFAVPTRAAAGKRLPEMLQRLAAQFGCGIDDLRLDHDPPLGAREKRGNGKATRYTPDANDPNHLNYRPHGPQFENSHLIKTNVRGEHGQHPDRVLIKKQRRLERGPKPKRGPKIQSAGFKRGQKSAWPKRTFGRKP